MKYINKLQSFMYGRYGLDDLYKFLFKLYIGLIILSLFIKSKILFILEFIIIIFMFYRVFSKNIYVRSSENQRFLKFKNTLLKPFINIKRNLNDKEHVYKRCNKCKTTLKLPLPSKRGIKHAKCPHCGKRVTIFTLKCQRVEIIRDGKKVKTK